MSVISTESGQIITTEGGAEIAIETPTSNGDIQQFDFSVDLLLAILWQYNNASNLQGLLEWKNNWYNTNQTQFWQDWLYNVFDLRTANEFGLGVWSIILGLPIYVNSAPVSVPTFGFDGSGGVNFDNGILADENGSSTLLPIETQRLALRLRYMQLTSAGCVPETNRALKYIFGNYGTAYLLDYGDMTQAYIFLFPLTWDLIYLFNNYDILPRPAGVQSSYVDATLQYFNFDGLNFDNGTLGG